LKGIFGAGGLDIKQHQHIKLDCNNTFDRRLHIFFFFFFGKNCKQKILSAHTQNRWCHNIKKVFLSHLSFIIESYRGNESRGAMLFSELAISSTAL
jgi:hypothetical protein